MLAIISDGGQCHEQNKTEAGHGGRLGMGCQFRAVKKGRMETGTVGWAAEWIEGNTPFLEKGPAFLSKCEPGVSEEQSWGPGAWNELATGTW